MANPSVSMPDELIDRIDESRGNVPRSRWIQEAARARLEAEERGSWGDGAFADDEDESGHEADAQPAD